MNDVAVELKNVSKLFGDVVAVDDVSVRIRENEFFSLLGPSGCGKTTTLRMIGGFEHPTTGDIYIADKLANNVPPHHRDTNLVFQQLALFPHMDVYDNIAFGLRMKRLPKAEIQDKVKRVLDLVDLPGMGQRRISQLSGGQQQRVAIARSLVNEPAVLLLDEPLGALDLKLRLQMQVELKDLQNRVGTTFIYVTHDQSEALTMSDRIAVMRAGRIEQLGTCTEVYEHPATRFVASFIGDSNLLQGRVTDVNGESGVVECNGVPIYAARNPTLREGEEVALSVRPERILVGDKAAGCPNLFPGRVLKVTYKGSLTDYKLELPFGVTMMAEVQAGAGQGFRKEEVIDVGWKKEATVAVRNE